MHACLGVPGELNALALVRGSGGMSITVVSSESRVDRSGVFRGALTVTKSKIRGEVKCERWIATATGNCRM